MWKYLVGMLALLSGCATMSTQTAQVTLEGGGKLNLTEVDWGVKGHGGSVTKHYVAEVITEDGSQAKVEIFDKTAQVGTAQQAVTALVGGIPGMVGQIGGAAVHGDAIKSAAKASAKAAVRQSEISLEAAQYVSDRQQETTMYAVDNTGPSVIDNSVTHFELSASAEGGQAVALQQQDQNQGQQQSQVSAPVSQAFAGTETNVDIGIGVNQPCTENCGF